MLCCIGDLVEDVVVWLASDISKGTDTEASISRRRGGSAANVAASAASVGLPVRFIGKVGSDAIGSVLIEALRSEGVDPRVRQGGRTGTIIVLVDPEGERSMLPDRAAATELHAVDPSDLDGVSWLHIPAYSLVVEPLAGAARQAIDTVRRSGGTISIDASSVAIIDSFGADAFREMLRHLHPDVLLCNAEEGTYLGVAAAKGVDGVELTVVKAGGGTAVAYSHGELVASAPAPTLAVVRDTTGAGDAFAAGFIGARMAALDIDIALAHGHRAAAELLAEHSS